MSPFDVGSGAGLTPQEFLAALSKSGSSPDDVMTAISSASSGGLDGEVRGVESGSGVAAPIDEFFDSFESAFYTDVESRRIEVDDFAYRSLRRDREEERRRTKNTQHRHFHVPEQRLEKVTSPRYQSCEVEFSYHGLIYLARLKMITPDVDVRRENR